MTDELKPCPFCGARDPDWFHVVYGEVNCGNCGAVGPCELTDAEAIAAWNRRAP